MKGNLIKCDGDVFSKTSVFSACRLFPPNATGTYSGGGEKSDSIEEIMNSAFDLWDLSDKVAPGFLLIIDDPQRSE